MAGFDLKNQPRFPVVTIDTDDPLSSENVTALFENTEGITLCVRSATGHQNRGGYFFCIQKREARFRLETIEGEEVALFSIDDIVRFINHSAGLRFDQEMQLYCQNNINFRND